MATITPVKESVEGGSFVATWTGVAPGDTCEPVQFGGAPDRSVQVVGTFGGATINIHGSNDGTNYTSLTDPQGNDIAITAAKIEAISELTRYFKPVISGGAGSSINVILFMRKA